MTDKPRLIEYAFPLKQASLDSVHEKNVRHGHISTLHIWPARRPLAACRAALIATLLPDPGTPEKRQELCEKIGGKVVKKIERKKMPGGRVVEREKEETEGGILHWKRETENAETLEWFRQEIRKAYGGRAPKVLDPFAGGGAIPLEAMRLGCEVTASDINPVAWFILKCTLEYPQKLAGQKRPLPDFILKDRAFMGEFFKKAQGMGKAGIRSQLKKLGVAANEDQQSLDFDKAKDVNIEADLAWHVRAWGRWVLDRARRDLARFYPTYADFEPLKKDVKSYEKQPMRLVPLKEDGKPDIDALNGEFSEDYLEVKSNPRWVAKPTVAYLWARTVTCKNCRATVPLLKTRWLCKKANKRVLLTMAVEAASPPLASSQHNMRGHTACTPPSSIEDLFGYFDPAEPIANLSGNLPHWRQEGVTYFVTFRLADSLPQAKLQQWLAEREAWLKAHPEPHDEPTRREYYRLFPARLERWLDAGYGQCILRRLEIKSLVENALRHFRGTRYYLDHDFVVMPNHVHTIVTPLDDHSLSSILHSWKSFTSHQINKFLGRSGTVWQKEYFDHIVRSPEQLERIRQYIRDNPKGAVEAASSPLDSPKTVEAKATRRDVASTIRFRIQTDVPIKGGNAAQKREHDKRVGAGTMSRAGATCPCCDTIMTMEDIRTEGRSARLDVAATAVVVDGQNGQEYREPTDDELRWAVQSGKQIERVFSQVPFGVPHEPIAGADALGMRVPLYGVDRWSKLFTPRQSFALGTFCFETRSVREQLAIMSYPSEWLETIIAALAIGMDRIADRQSMICRWDNGYTKLQGTFTRFALPIVWDFCEGNPLSHTTGNYTSCLEWVAKCFEHSAVAGQRSPAPKAIQQSAIRDVAEEFDCIVTDPPYYDAIPYSDLMDFFYVWLRRTVHGLSPELDTAFHDPTSPKWDHEANDGELVDDESRHGGDSAKSKAVYEDGMARAFGSCLKALHSDGRLVIVFAHKHPDAWETLVSAIIRAGFVVDGSWPIQTEMGNRTRALTGAALASSVWLVCKKRPATARPGWDNAVLDEMRGNIKTKLRDFWDAGIRGPDFVWAATGPALEAYSKHPVVKKANEPGPMTVSEFLTHVRRMVVDFVVGRVLSGSDVSSLHAGSASGEDATSTLDDPTSYYLLHRHDFDFGEAPAGTCILYAVSCGLSDRELVDNWNLLSKGGGSTATANGNDVDPDSEAEADEGSGSKLKLKTWAQRKNRTMGYEAPGGRPVPLIDQVHRLMHLWRGGDVHKVDEYLDDHGLRRHELFNRLLQSLIELSQPGSDERSILESLSNHIGAKGAKKTDPQKALAFGDDE